MKVRVKQLSKFVKETRDLKVGDEIDVNWTSKVTDPKGRESTHYLVDDKKGKAITLYEEEIEVIQD